jgi:hypothetical protein
MPLPGPGRLHLEGQVSFTVDGPGGSTAGVARGDGPVLRVSADDPVLAWEAVSGVAPGLGGFGDLADLLHDGGVAVEVSGPQGVVGTVGLDVDSPLGAVLTGSRRVRMGGASAVRGLVLSQARTELARRRRPLLVALGLVVLVAARRRRSRS